MRRARRQPAPAQLERPWRLSALADALDEGHGRLSRTANDLQQARGDLEESRSQLSTLEQRQDALIKDFRRMRHRPGYDTGPLRDFASELATLVEDSRYARDRIASDEQRLAELELRHEAVELDVDWLEATEEMRRAADRWREVTRDHPTGWNTDSDRGDAVVKEYCAAEKRRLLLLSRINPDALPDAWLCMRQELSAFFAGSRRGPGLSVPIHPGPVFEGRAAGGYVARPHDHVFDHGHSGFPPPPPPVPRNRDLLRAMANIIWCLLGEQHDYGPYRTRVSIWQRAFGKEWAVSWTANWQDVAGVKRTKQR